jgi:hypothetical protein
MQGLLYIITNVSNWLDVAHLHIEEAEKEYTLILNKFIHTFFISVFSHSICFPRLNVRRLFPSMLCSYLRPTNQNFLALKALSHKVLCSFNTHTTNTQDNFPSLDKMMIDKQHFS